MRIPLGIHLGERFTLEETWAAAEIAENHGFDSLWVAEGRLTRDAVSIMALLAERTNTVRIGSGVVNNKSRNAALMAVTFKTLDEIAPGRIVLGIGAWWEPLASRVGTPLSKPVVAMREYVGVLQAFFRNEEVTVDGEFVHMDGVRFDRMYAENVEVDIPIYAGAVGPRMLQLAGETMDGVYLDFLLPVDYLTSARASIDKGLAARADGRTSIDITQAIAVAVDDDDPRSAIDACKAFLTLYLMQQPHIAEHCGVEPELVDRIKQVAGWPATPDDIKRAMVLLPDEAVLRVAAAGTTADVVEKLEEYHEAGVRVPVLNPLGGRKLETIESLARAFH
ncbi:LLM class flavin-dependent oxidoreductase [Agromyces atrinae]|uniref:5,10-methylenetetrahydromethanopterin reductase n=1 Tax=Agromyces atrinae TaxID=592376 RepID=A0A4Q2M8T6_9MICO|nr:LLM class flavin-dependent oxidoreductase [Agromyces atrinae]NYD68052.1 5,10-methylenetetrahydromethanopterin reductase [Agromyces atrinae]RXZ87797.1 LLM class flavin-dependent oxidoreductase [Agromyces atrinae]